MGGAGVTITSGLVGYFGGAVGYPSDDDLEARRKELLDTLNRTDSGLDDNSLSSRLSALLDEALAAFPFLEQEKPGLYSEGFRGFRTVWWPVFWRNSDVVVTAIPLWILILFFALCLPLCLRSCARAKKMTTCGVCGKMISKQAERCPRCGDPRSSKNET